MGKVIFTVLCLSIVLVGVPVWADVTDQSSHDHTTVDFGAGYRWFGTTGSLRAEEYERQSDSWTLDGSANLILLSHRLFLDADMRNNEDYFGDATYGYSDLLLMRVVNSTGFHNTDNVTLQNLDPAASDSRVDVRDDDAHYGMQYSITRASVLAKTPNFPFHVFAVGDMIQKDRTMQQRSLQGSGLFNDRVRTSQRRNIDWQTVSYTAGVNSHLGPVEVELSHKEKRFDASDDAVLLDSFAEAAAGVNVVRAAGVYPHNLISETKGSASTVKLHTAHTGKIVGSITLSIKDRENQGSGASADVFLGKGALTWVPTPKVAFFVTYYHRDLDVDNPETVTVADASNPSNTYGNSSVRPSLSSITDTVSVAGRFRLIPKTTFRTSYAYRDRRREESEAWYLPDSSHVHSAAVSVDTRLIPTITAKAEYKYRFVSDPVYNNEPDERNEGRLTVTWMPLQRVVAMGQYWISKENRDILHFVDTGGSFEIPADRDVTRDRILANVTVLLLDRLTVTGTYAYMHNKTQQGIVYHSSIAPFDRMIDEDVPQKTTAFHYGVNLHYTVGERLSLGGGVTYTLTRGLFSPDDAGLVEPVNVSSFSRIKVRETVYNVSGEYELLKGLRVIADYRYSSFDDVLENSYDDVSDGTAQIFWVGFSKRFG